MLEVCQSLSSTRGRGSVVNFENFKGVSAGVISSGKILCKGFGTVDPLQVAVTVGDVVSG